MSSPIASRCRREYLLEGKKVHSDFDVLSAFATLVGSEGVLGEGDWDRHWVVLG